MRRIASIAKHAVFLVRNLGFQRFTIVLIYWVLRRYRRWTGIAYRHRISKTSTISRDPVLVYQMSKVGSTSLIYSLQFAYVKAGLPNVVLHHAHTLTNLDLHEKLLTDAHAPSHAIGLVNEYRQIRNAFEADPNQRWKIISVVRDPVARQISDFFHHIDRHLPNWRQRWSDRRLRIDEVLQSFLTVSDPTIHWFEGEILAVAGIDVYAAAFPCEAGFAIYSRPGKADLVVIRLEDMDQVAPLAIEQLLGLKNFKLYSFNMASESDYGEIYKAFKTTPLPAWYLERTYSNRMARHFYTEAELHRFTAKWNRTGATVATTPAPGVTGV